MLLKVSDRIRQLEFRYVEPREIGRFNWRFNPHAGQFPLNKRAN
jgi:hypothetical protein